MRVNAVQFKTAPVVLPGEGSRGPIKTDSVQNEPNKPQAGPSAVISFGGAKNKNQIALALAELPPFMKVGGVATVGNDYMNMGNWLEETLRQSGLSTDGTRIGIFMPYYNGDVKHDRVTGYPTGEVKPHKIGDKFVFISPDVLEKKPMSEIQEKGLYTELIEMDSRDMSWGLEEKTPIKLFKVKDPPIPQKNVDIYMVYNEATAGMPRAYAGGIAYSSGSRIITDKFKGDPYARFSKSFVETMPALEKHGFSPETIICSDAQTSFVAEYAAQKNLAGQEYFDGLKVSHIFHNVGPGYCGETSAQNMFSDFATPEQIKTVMLDREYFKALREGHGDDYFKRYIARTLDANGTPNPNMIPLYHLQQGYVTAVDTVSEGYAEAIAVNPNVSPGLHKTWTGLYESGRVGGILNGFEDERVSAFRPVNLEGYATEQVWTDSKGNVHKFPPIEVFQDKDKITFDSMRATKRANKINVLSRMTGEIQDNRIMTGNPNRSYTLYGYIDQKYVQMLKDGKDVPMFAEWGRGDAQKGHTIALNAFRKFAKTEEGKDAVLVMGAGLTPGLDETKRIQSALQEVLDDPALKGRVVFFDGFAPSYAMASASDATLIASKFAPCELVDLEAARYFSTPIVTNTQGLAQKNFDPRNQAEALKANAYKTTHEFDMLDEVVDRIISAFTSENKEMQNEVAQEFSQVDREVFKRFGAGYTQLLEQNKKAIGTKVAPEFLNTAAMKAMRGSREYEILIRGLKEDILADEMAEAMSACVKNLGAEAGDTSAAVQIFKNQLQMDTSWTRNNGLHPGGKSSWEMYKARHIDPQPQRARSSVFEFMPPDESRLITESAKTGAAATTDPKGAAKAAGAALSGNSEPLKAASGASSAQQGARTAFRGASEGGAIHSVKEQGAKLFDGLKSLKGKTGYIAAAIGAAALGAAIIVPKITHWKQEKQKAKMPDNKENQGTQAPNSYNGIPQNPAQGAFEPYRQAQSPLRERYFTAQQGGNTNPFADMQAFQNALPSAAYVLGQGQGQNTQENKFKSVFAR